MKKQILIVEDNVVLSQLQRDWLSKEGYNVFSAINEPYARKLIRKEHFDLMFSDVRLPEGDGISLLEWLNKEKRRIPFVIMTEYASYPDAVRAIKLGAEDYLPKPVHRERLLELARELLRPASSVRREGKTLYKRLSPKAVEAERLAGLVAPSDISVLILGANGTGKESVARIIHEKSNRKEMPFVAVNCGAIPRELAPSLLFGHTRGAFTGAEANKEGYFDMAQGGTLFLDEIGTLPYEIQSLLLRVLQENIYMPIGGTKERVADVRIVAATNENLEEAIGNHRFREDLYHRLSEFEIYQPALQECPEDILPLADFFRKRFSDELHKETTNFSKEAQRLLLSYPWPGNIRELQNKVRRAVLIATTTVINKADLNIQIRTQSREAPSQIFLPLKDYELEKQTIIAALKSCDGNRTRAARLLNINPATLYRKMRKHEIT